MNCWVGGSWTFVPTVSFSTADIVSWGIQRRMVVDGVWGCPIHIQLYRYLTTSLVSSSFLFLSSFSLPSFLPILLPQHRLGPQNSIPYPLRALLIPYLTFIRARERVPYLEPLLLFNVEVKLGVLDLTRRLDGRDFEAREFGSSTVMARSMDWLSRL